MVETASCNRFALPVPRKYEPVAALLPCFRRNGNAATRLRIVSRETFRILCKYVAFTTGPPWKKYFRRPWIESCRLTCDCDRVGRNLWGGDSSVVEGPPLDWQVKCSIHGHCAPWARAFISIAPARSQILGFGLTPPEFRFL